MTARTAAAEVGRELSGKTYCRSQLRSWQTWSQNLRRILIIHEHQLHHHPALVHPVDHDSSQPEVDVEVVL